MQQKKSFAGSFCKGSLTILGLPRIFRDVLDKTPITSLMTITEGKFPTLPKLGITGLLNDFQYVWLKRLNTSYHFELLDAARSLCNGENKKVFTMTHSKSVDQIRNKMSSYIDKWHNKDNRVILKLLFDGKKIDAEWLELEKYLELSQPLE